MPMCFQLISKTTGTAGKMNEIDDALCAALGVKPHPQWFYSGWYDWFGPSLACGVSWDECREFTKDTELLRVADWLEANYTVNHWRE